MHKKSLVNVLGVVYAHLKTGDGGDLYLTRYAEPYQKHFNIGNWYEKRWFRRHRVRLKGTGSVYRVPTKKVDGKSLMLVVKNCRVGEDVPFDTHTLEEFCDAEFNSPWEEFSLVMEMREGQYGPKDLKIQTQLPMAIYVPPEKMQPWQSGRSRAKINRIRARHPGIDLDILKQYKLIYRWIDGSNLPEVFECINIERDKLLYHLDTLDRMVMADLNKKGYLVADTKPEHIIIDESDVERIREIGNSGTADAVMAQVYYLYHLINMGRYSVVDYELLQRTPEHETLVQSTRRHSYLDDQRDRFIPTPLPSHLKRMEIFGVPYIYGHAESTGGHLWVVGNNARLFDYFLPERWRKTPSIRLSEKKEVYYTITKDNIHLVWETSRVGEMPDPDLLRRHPVIMEHGINSPFEEFAIAHDLQNRGIPCVYVRAIYMTGSSKIEKTLDMRKYESHRNVLDPEGKPILREDHDFITIRGYYNGPDHWVAEQTGPLYKPVDLEKAVKQNLIGDKLCMMLLEKVKNDLAEAGYDGMYLKPDDLLIAIDGRGDIVMDDSGLPMVVICNFEALYRLSGSSLSESLSS
jgi:hypothetical protein